MTAQGALPRMTFPRALRSERLRLARSPLLVAHLACGLAGGLACGEYFCVARWDPALSADAYAQFLGALMPLMSGIVCGLAIDEERAAGGLAHGLMTGELTGLAPSPLAWIPFSWPARLGSLGAEVFIDTARAAAPLVATALAGAALSALTVGLLIVWSRTFEGGRSDA